METLMMALGEDLDHILKARNDFAVEACLTNDPEEFTTLRNKVLEYEGKAIAILECVNRLEQGH